ncbi:CRAL/TRIO domain [Musa troglodytarum]|uniref:CRAL/TRIO domain n=1 Tax=Musa troglodytarum TaxID=320322 RepID=A0A9E7F7D7_9LILI|nr:CRAL/TRIO domain [Musa troglodytarum]
MEPCQATVEVVASPKPATKRNLLGSLMEAAAGLQRSSSFKEDSYLASSLKPAEKKALQELKRLLSTSPKPISMWGVPVAPAAADERADVVLLKFLRARDFDVGEAHAMLLRCAEWRREFGADGVAEEEQVGLKEVEGVVAFMHGWDRRGHPVCYNAYGVFKDAAVYERVLGDADKLQRFLRWRVQVMERGVRLLHLRPGGINSIIQVTDLKDMPKRELRAASNHILSLFQDNYPEMVARKVGGTAGLLPRCFSSASSSQPCIHQPQVFINVPWYFSVLYAMISPFLTERTKSKFVIAREGNVAETLYKFIRPEFVPVQYGGLSRPGDLQNGPPKPATEFAIKGGEQVNLEIDGIEGGATIAWDVAVGGWDVDYGAEFVPSDEGSYTVVVQKTRRIPAGAEEAVHDAFTAKEAGKMVLSIDNTNSRRRKVAAYRYCVRKPSM